MKTTPSASRGRAGSAPHPAGPTTTSGHGPGSEARTCPNARTRRSTFLRGSSVLTVRRNSPVHAQPAEQRVGRLGIGVRQEVGAAGDDGDAALLDADGDQVGRDPPGRDEERGPPVAGTRQRGLVPAQPAPGRRLGVALPGHVVDRHDQAAPAVAPEPR